ncbi:MAG: choice-of-anchor P family protein, partial [Actinomycetota bacterium]
MAAGTVGSFEIDGNRPDSAAGEPLDWSSLAASGARVVEFDDPKNSNSDDVYKDGSKALEPGGWACNTKKAPPKDDIVKAALGFRKVGTDRFMYVNWERYSTNGTANIDYEFSQSNLEVCPGLPVRTEGDIIITYDFDNGGGSITIHAFRWHFTGPGVGQYVQDDATLIEHQTYDAEVNRTNTTEPGLKAGAFGEASINLTKTIGDICPKFASAYVRTRSSTSITSDPKDRTKKASDICPPPNPKITKTAAQSSVEVGGTVTFNLAFANDSTEGTATSAIITDTLPPGTAFVSCTGGCSVSGNTVTWEVGPLPPGASGSVSLTIQVLQLPAQCQLCNTATIDSPQKAGSPDATSTACIHVGPGPAPGVASANGRARGIHISDTGFGIDTNITDVTSSQTGPGVDSNDASQASIRIPTNPLSPPVLEVNLIQGVSTSQVLTQPAAARQNTVAQVTGLNILDRVITAELVRAAGLAEATEDGSNWNTLGTGFVNLKIDTDGPLGPGQPQVYDNVNPGAFIDLSSLFGKGPQGEKSGVTLRKVTGSTTGTFVSDVTVTMIDVTAWDRDPVSPGKQTTKVQVSTATSHAEHPSATGCPGAVSGHAFIASETTDPELIPITVGFVSIPAYGGHDEQAINQLFLPADGSVLTSELTKSVSDGTLTPTSATSSDYAELKNLCVLKDAAGPGCLVGATLVGSQAASSDGSSGGASSNDTGTQFVA